MPLAQLGYSAERWEDILAEQERSAREEGLRIPVLPRVANSRRALMIAEAAKRAGAVSLARLEQAAAELLAAPGAPEQD